MSAYVLAQVLLAIALLLVIPVQRPASIFMRCQEPFDISPV